MTKNPSPLTAIADSLHHSAATAAQLLDDERATIRQSLDPLSQRAHQAAITLAAKIEAHNAAITRLVRGEDSPWQMPAQGRDHPDYSRLDAGLKRWQTMKGSVLPF